MCADHNIRMHNSSSTSEHPKLDHTRGCRNIMHADYFNDQTILSKRVVSNRTAKDFS